VKKTQPNDDDLSDEDLLSRLQKGETVFFGLLVRRYERELYAYLRRYTGDAELAADVFQNTCLAVFRKIKHYQPGRAARPWLYTITTNQAIDAMRQRSRQRENRGQDRATVELARALAETASANSTTRDPADTAALTEAQAQVRDAVAALPETLRQVVLLIYFQGMKYQDAADILNVPLGTVKSRLHAAHARLFQDWTGPVPEPTE
jgi:RNA polymerase sigma-70 factor (ECF subfamily)